MPVLRLVPLKGDPILVDAADALVGREPSCNVVVSHPSVSRQHARLKRSGDAFSVEDQGSANGTFVNSKRVANAPLRAGDSLRFGSATFAVEVLGDAELLSIDEDELVSGRTLHMSGEGAFSETMVSGDAVPAVVGHDDDTAERNDHDGDATAAMPAPDIRPSAPSAPPPPPRPSSGAARVPSSPHSLPPRPWSAPQSMPPRPRTIPPAAAPPPHPPVGPTAHFPALEPESPPAPPAPALIAGRTPMFWAGVAGLGCLVVVLLIAAVVFGFLYLQNRG